MRKRTQARECALKVLYQVDMASHPVEDVLSTFWEASPAPEVVRDYAELIVRGTCEHMDCIDKTIVQYTENWELKRMAVVDRNILRFSVYELLYLTEIPPKVTINEAVNIAKKYSQIESGKFVNGILDKISHSEKKVSPSETIPNEGSEK